jgi:stage II sporulation protein GA (sporulation sigma-E factor processing peptidase)
MNFLILRLSAYILGRAFSAKGMLAAALLGSIYALGEVMAVPPYFYHWTAKLLAAAVMVYLAFGYKSTRSFLLISGVFFLVSFLFGGAVIGWLYFLEPFGGSIGKINWQTLGGGVLLAAVLIFVSARALTLNIFQRQNLYLFTIRAGEKEFTGQGFLDTGNFLYSPVGRRPVVLLEQAACWELLPLNVAAYFKKTAPENWLGNLALLQDEKWLSQVEIIPYTALGATDLLLGFRPDEIIIFDQEKKFATSSFVAAVAAKPLMPENCSALLHPALLNHNDKEK